eukprot:PhM_4_TR15517/c0_g1_i1/m.39846
MNIFDENDAPPQEQSVINTTTENKRSRDELETEEAPHRPTTTNIKKNPPSHMGPNQCGFLFTVHPRNIVLAKREVETILSDFVAEALNSQQSKKETMATTTAPTASSDFFSALQAELATAKASSRGGGAITSSSVPGFRAVNCEAKGNLFYVLPSDLYTGDATGRTAPSEILRTMFETLTKRGDKTARNVFRSYPVNTTCWSKEDQILRAAAYVIEQLVVPTQLPPPTDKKAVTVSVIFNVKSHTTLEERSSDVRAAILKMFWDA